MTITELLQAREVVKGYRDRMINDKSDALNPIIIRLNEEIQSYERLVGERLAEDMAGIKDVFLFFDYIASSIKIK